MLSEKLFNEMSHRSVPYALFFGYEALTAASIPFNFFEDELIKDFICFIFVMSAQIVSKDLSLNYFSCFFKRLLFRSTPIT